MSTKRLATDAMFLTLALVVSYIEVLIPVPVGIPGVKLGLANGVPYCDECGGIIKPDVVLYEEGLDSQTINGAVRAISKADMLIIGGTSLVVYPAAGMIDYFKGKYLAVLNRDATSRDKQADLCITDPIGEVLGRIRV